MTNDFAISARESRRTLTIAFIMALICEAFLLTALGWDIHWISHPLSDADRLDGFVEAQIFEAPPEAKLAGPSVHMAAKRSEPTLSKVAHQGRTAPAEQSNVDQPNQTDDSQGVVANHGPVAVFSPAPKIPESLQSADLHTSVVIDFYVSAQGASTPRLVGSSSNEELDALALAAAKKWVFHPAEVNHKPVDAKLRLRVVFEVQ